MVAMGSALKKNEPSVVIFISSQGKNHQEIFNDSQDRRSLLRYQWSSLPS
jgi:hypothetical protein